MESKLENIMEKSLRGIIFAGRLACAPILFPFGVYYNKKGNPYSGQKISLKESIVETAQALNPKALYIGVPEAAQSLTIRMLRAYQH